MKIEPINRTTTISPTSTNQPNKEVHAKTNKEPFDATKKESKEHFSDNKKEANNVSAESIKKAVENLNRNMSDSEAIFGIHDETNRVTIKIINKETKEVVREIPAEKTLDMIAKAWELAGILVDERR